MKAKTLVEKVLQTVVGRRHFRREELIMEVTEAIARTMADLGLTHDDLAALLGVTKGRVSQIMQGENMTLGTVAAIFQAMGVVLSPFCATPIKEPESCGFCRRRVSFLSTHLHTCRRRHVAARRSDAALKSTLRAGEGGEG